MSNNKQSETYCQRHTICTQGKVYSHSHRHCLLPIHGVPENSSALLIKQHRKHAHMLHFKLCKKRRD